MKNKVITLTLVLFLVLGLAMFSIKANVFAQLGTVSGKAESNSLASGQFIPSTVTGTEEGGWVVTSAGSYGIPMEDVSAGPDGQKLISNGLQLEGPALICYPFRGAQFGWHGLIRVLDGTKWWPLATTIAWTPDEEGKLMACAQAPAAGTYALWAWWEPLP
jgi:hypothetical protein